MTGWQIMAAVIGVLVVVAGVVCWRYKESRKRPDLAKSAGELARDKLEATKREGQHASEESRQGLEAELEMERLAAEREMNRDDPDLDVLGRPRRR